MTCASISRVRSLALSRRARWCTGTPFLPFYAVQLQSLQETWGSPGLPRGVLHGDPFLDNVLCSPADGSLEGFVDMEDVCIGPLLFDRCCAASCCFRASDNALDMRKMRHLLEGSPPSAPSFPLSARPSLAS